MNTLTDIPLRRLLTPSITTDPKVLSQADALTPNLTAIAPASGEALILSRIDSLSENMTDLLAWQLHCDFYDLAYDLPTKKRMVKSSILWHMKKGTVAGIMEALRLIDIRADLTNWYEEGQPPYTFRISAIVAGPFYRTTGKDKLASSIRRAVNEAKAERSLMSKLDIRIEETEAAKFTPALFWVRNLDINLGLGDDDMHELLLIFEQRILDKLASYGEIFAGKMNQMRDDISDRIAENERATLERIGEYEENTASRIAGSEARTEQRILAYDQAAIERMARYEGSVNAMLNVYHLQDETYYRDVLERIGSLKNEVAELRECLTWGGVK